MSEWESRRRSILKGFLAVPLVSTFKRLNAFGEPGDSSSVDINDPVYQQKFLAVRILRLVNTAEAWFKKEYGHYADLDQLNSSTTMKKFLESDKAETRGIGRTLHTQLQFNQDEIVPGWMLAHTIRQDLMGYVSLATPMDTKSFPSYSTDHKGIIFEGQALAGYTSPSLIVAANQALESGTPIKAGASASPDRLKSILKSLAFAPHWICICRACTQYPCCCDPCCACAQDCTACFLACMNCGCESCAWCCC